MREPISLLWEWSSIEMATGKKAFQGESKASLAAAILTSDPVPITKIQPSAPIALERALGKCLNKDPEERWQTARDLAGELKWILEDLASSGTSAASRTQRPDGQKALPPSFIEGLPESGYQRIALEEVIRLRNHGVSPEFIEGLKRAGYAGLPIDQLIRLRNHGVTPEYIEKMKAQGFKSLSIDQLVKRRHRQSERRAWLASLPPWHSRLQGRSGSISPGSLKVFLR